jgi:hypothetical protein
MTQLKLTAALIMLTLGTSAAYLRAGDGPAATSQPVSAVGSPDAIDVAAARQCLKDLVGAVLAEDSDRVHAALEPETTEVAPLARALAESWLASARLSRVAAAAFGDEMAEGLLADDPNISTRAGWTTGVLGPLSTAPVTVHGNGMVRILTEPESRSPWRLRKTDGRWRVLVAAEHGYDVERGVRDLKAVTDRHHQIADEIANGTIKGPPALRDRVRAAVEAANIGADGPAEAGGPQFQ